jgi:Flp pilus assembly protein TadB
MEEKNLSEEESLDLIHAMIQVAKNDHRENGDGWLIWGWLLFTASVLSVVFIQLDVIGYISYVWVSMLAIGLIINVLFHIRNRRKTGKTYVQDLLDKLGTGFFISLFVIVFSASLADRQSFSFGYYYILYAFWMFIHGSAIRFRPLIMGAIVNWAAAIAIFLVADFKYDMMISALAILIGYLIPGYQLRAEYKRSLTSAKRTTDGV